MAFERDYDRVDLIYSMLLRELPVTHTLKAEPDLTSSSNIRREKNPDNSFIQVIQLCQAERQVSAKRTTGIHVGLGWI